MNHDENIDTALRSRFVDASAQMGGSQSARRRVVDPTPRGSLRPLAAGLAVAVVAGAAGAALARHVHQTTPAGAAHRAQATAAPKPSALPPKVVELFSPFFRPNNLTLAGDGAYGHLALTGTDNTLLIGHYGLAISADPGSPGFAPVWRLDRPPAPSAAELNARFASGVAPTPDDRGIIPSSSASYDPNTGMMQYNTGTLAVGGPSIGGVPADAASAGELATAFLNQRGLLPEGAGAPQVQTIDNAPPERWIVVWPFISASVRIDGPTGRAVMGIGPQGNVIDFMETWLPVNGGSRYPLIPWRRAWSQVAAGRYYRECCAFTGGNGPSSQPSFVATSVHIGYVMPDFPTKSPTERDYLVPMWVFTDSGGTELFYPAVAPSGLTYTYAPHAWPSPR